MFFCSRVLLAVSFLLQKNWQVLSGLIAFWLQELGEFLPRERIQPLFVILSCAQC